MARVYKRGKRWYMDVIDPRTKRRVRRVLPADTKRDAADVMRAIQRKWELGESLPGERETVSFKTLVEEYWQTHVEGSSNRRGTPHKRATRATDRSRLDRLEAQFGERAVAEIGAPEYSRFLDALLKEGMTVSSRNRYIAVLRPLLRLAVQRGWLVAMPELPPMRSEPRRAETVLTDKELTALLAQCDKSPPLGERVRWLLFTALRLGETFPTKKSRGLMWEDVRLDEKVVVLRDTKSGQDAVVHLHPEAVQILRARYAKAAKVALQSGSGKPTGPVWSGTALDDPSNFRRAFKSALTAAKADQRFRLHDLRAQHAVALLRQGEDVETVRLALRHASLTTTGRYLRHVEGQVASAVRRLAFPAVL